MPAISAIIAARNEEANIAAAVLSLAVQPEIAEIIVVDDQSTDRTAQVLAELGTQVPNLRVLQAGALPAGWVGKNHALWLGARHARGEWLLFTDADVTHLPGSAVRALRDASETGAALVSYSPEQETRTWWERAIIPFVFTRLARMYAFDEVNDPAHPTAAANGQFLMSRRDAYDASGGHAVVRGNVLEDVDLARRMKRLGYRLHFASGLGIARTRMYASFAAMWQGWTKNLFPLVGNGRNAIVEVFQALSWLCVLLVLPFLAFGIWIGIAAGVLISLHVRYALRLRSIGAPAWGVLYYLPGSALYSALLMASAWRHHRGSVEWKGREYPVESR